jgi:hypothetical protein
MLHVGYRVGPELIALQKQFLELVARRMRSPDAAGTRFAKFLESLETAKALPIELLLVGIPSEDLSVNLLGSAHLVEKDEIVDPSSSDDLKAGVALIRKRARNTHRTEKERRTRGMGLKTARDYQVPAILAARLELVRRVVDLANEKEVNDVIAELGLNWATKQEVSERLVPQMTRVIFGIALLHDADDPDVQRLVRNTAMYVAGKKEDLADATTDEYLANPLDPLGFDPGFDLEEVWKYFCKTILNRFRKVREAHNRGSTTRAPSRTARYRRQHGLPMDPGPSRRAVARAFGVDPKILKGFEEAGLIHPERHGRNVFYRSSDVTRARKLLAEKRQGGCPR